MLLTFQVIKHCKSCTVCFCLSVSTVRREAENLYPAIVTSDGNVSMLAPVIYISSCDLDMT